MKVIRSISEYFLADADEEIPVSELCWFYVPYILVAIIVLLTALSI
ncbi:hypothetical protein [Paenisporosarcina sp. NPDC076898]